MSLNRAVTALVIGLSGCSNYPAAAADACPVRGGQPLRFVDVFDGPAAELATLVPDKAGERAGYWLLDYIYDAGRFVVIRCKYADKEHVDVKLSNRVHRCDYTIDTAKALVVYCK